MKSMITTTRISNKYKIRHIQRAKEDTDIVVTLETQLALQFNVIFDVSKADYLLIHQVHV